MGRDEEKDEAEEVEGGGEEEQVTAVASMAGVVAAVALAAGVVAAVAGVRWKGWPRGANEEE